MIRSTANFALPEVGSWIDEAVFPELSEEECKKVVEGFHKEARAAGVLREKEKRDRSEGRDQPPHKRARDDDRKRRDDRRSRDGYSRDRGQCHWRFHILTEADHLGLFRGHLSSIHKTKAGP